VLGVDAQPMWAVEEAVAEGANKGSGGVEFHQRTGSAMQDEDVSLGIDRHARRAAERHARGQPERVGHRDVVERRRTLALRPCRRGDQRGAQPEQNGLHGSSYSGLMPAVLITLAHLSRSRRISCSNSPGSSANGVTCCSVKSLTTSGSRMTASVSRDSRVTMSFGVRTGTMTPTHGAIPKPGPVSATAGRSGRAGMRCGSATASALICPDCELCSRVCTLLNPICTSPPTRARLAGPVPLVGPCPQPHPG